VGAFGSYAVLRIEFILAGINIDDGNFAVMEGFQLGAEAFIINALTARDDFFSRWKYWLHALIIANGGG